MTTKQADRLIGKRIVLVTGGWIGEVIIARRDRWCIETTCGKRIDRTDVDEAHPI